MRVHTDPSDLVHEVAQGAGIRFHRTGGATLITCGDANPFLDACAAAGVRVIGAEGFELVEGSRRPDMEAILDLGGLDDRGGSVAEARAFVASVCRNGLLLEWQLERA